MIVSSNNRAKRFSASLRNQRFLQAASEYQAEDLSRFRLQISKPRENKRSIW